MSDLLVEGDVLWTLTDHLGTVRDLAQHDPTTGETTIASHRVYDAFGNLVTQGAAVDHLFGFTGRALDESTGLQNNLNRWYDAETGRWISQDPIDFEGEDTNLYRYVGNTPGTHTDPTGLYWKRFMWGIFYWWDIDQEKREFNGQVSVIRGHSVSIGRIFADGPHFSPRRLLTRKNRGEGVIEEKNGSSD